MTSLSTLTPSEAHRLVVNWVRKNHVKFPFKQEVILRDSLVEFANADGRRRDASAFADWLSEKFPKFFEDVFLRGGKK